MLKLQKYFFVSPTLSQTFLCSKPLLQSYKTKNGQLSNEVEAGLNSQLKQYVLQKGARNSALFTKHTLLKKKNSLSYQPSLRSEFINKDYQGIVSNLGANQAHRIKRSNKAEPCKSPYLMDKWSKSSSHNTVREITNFQSLPQLRWGTGGKAFSYPKTFVCYWIFPFMGFITLFGNLSWNSPTTSFLQLSLQDVKQNKKIQEDFALPLLKRGAFFKVRYIGATLAKPMLTNVDTLDEKPENSSLNFLKIHWQIYKSQLKSESQMSNYLRSSKVTSFVSQSHKATQQLANNSQNGLTAKTLSNSFLKGLLAASASNPFKGVAWVQGKSQPPFTIQTIALSSGVPKNVSPAPSASPSQMDAVTTSPQSLKFAKKLQIYNFVGIYPSKKGNQQKWKHNPLNSYTNASVLLDNLLKNLYFPLGKLNPLVLSASQKVLGVPFEQQLEKNQGNHQLWQSFKATNPKMAPSNVMETGNLWQGSSNVLKPSTKNVVKSTYLFLTKDSVMPFNSPSAKPSPIKKEEKQLKEVEATNPQKQNYAELSKTELYRAIFTALKNSMNKFTGSYLTATYDQKTLLFVNQVQQTPQFLFKEAFLSASRSTTKEATFKKMLTLVTPEGLEAAEGYAPPATKNSILCFHPLFLSNLEPSKQNSFLNTSLVNSYKSLQGRIYNAGDGARTDMSKELVSKTLKNSLQISNKNNSLPLFEAAGQPQTNKTGERSGYIGVFKRDAAANVKSAKHFKQNGPSLIVKLGSMKSSHFNYSKYLNRLSYNLKDIIITSQNIPELKKLYKDKTNFYNPVTQAELGLEAGVTMFKVSRSKKKASPSKAVTLLKGVRSPRRSAAERLGFKITLNSTGRHTLEQSGYIQKNVKSALHWRSQCWHFKQNGFGFTEPKGKASTFKVKVEKLFRTFMSVKNNTVFSNKNRLPKSGVPKQYKTKGLVSFAYTKGGNGIRLLSSAGTAIKWVSSKSSVSASFSFKQIQVRRSMAGSTQAKLGLALPYGQTPTLLLKNRLFFNNSVQGKEQTSQYLDSTTKFGLLEKAYNQKKRRLKKQKKETRRRKKRKRFYPRPIYTMYRLYKNVIYKTSSLSPLQKVDKKSNSRFVDKKVKLGIRLPSSAGTTSQANGKVFNKFDKSYNTNVLYPYGTKENFRISSTLLTELKRERKVSSLYRSKIDSYFSKIKLYFQDLKQIYTYLDLMDCSKNVINKLFVENFNTNTILNRTNFNLEWQTALNLSEYNRITYERIQQYILQAIRNRTFLTNLDLPLSSPNEITVEPKKKQDDTFIFKNSSMLAVPHLNNQLLLTSNSLFSSAYFYKNKIKTNLDGQAKDFWSKQLDNLNVFSCISDSSKLAVFENQNKPISNLRLFWAINKTNYGSGFPSPLRGAGDAEQNSNKIALKRKETWISQKFREQTKNNKTKKIFKDLFEKCQFLLDTNLKMSEIVHTRLFAKTNLDQVSTQNIGSTSVNVTGKPRLNETLSNLYKRTFMKLRKKEEKYNYFGFTNVLNKGTLTNKHDSSYQKMQSFYPGNSNQLFNIFSANPSPLWGAGVTATNVGVSAKRTGYGFAEPSFLFLGNQIPATLPRSGSSKFTNNYNYWWSNVYERSTLNGFLMNPIELVNLVQNTLYTVSGCAKEVAAKDFSFVQNSTSIFYNSNFETQNFLTLPEGQPGQNLKEGRKVTANLANRKSELGKNSLIVFWASSILFHFCIIISLISISQIRDYIRFILLIVSKFYKGFLGVSSAIQTYMQFQLTKNKKDKLSPGQRSLLMGAGVRLRRAEQNTIFVSLLRRIVRFRANLMAAEGPSFIFKSPIKQSTFSSPAFKRVLGSASPKRANTTTFIKNLYPLLLVKNTSVLNTDVYNEQGTIPTMLLSSISKKRILSVTNVGAYIGEANVEPKEFDIFKTSQIYTLFYKALVFCFKKPNLSIKKAKADSRFLFVNNQKDAYRSLTPNPVPQATNVAFRRATLSSTMLKVQSTLNKTEADKRKGLAVTYLKGFTKQRASNPLSRTQATLGPGLAVTPHPFGVLGLEGGLGAWVTHEKGLASIKNHLLTYHLKTKNLFLLIRNLILINNQVNVNSVNGLSSNSYYVSQVVPLQSLYVMSRSLNRFYVGGYNVFKQSIDSLSNFIRSIYTFFEKPGELIIDMVAYMFLVEWASDFTNTIPQSFLETYIDGTYPRKLARQINGLNAFTNFDIFLKTLNVPFTFSYIVLLNTMIFSMFKRISYNLYQNLVEQFYQPDTDALMRQKKGLIFWDIWGDFLIQVATTKTNKNKGLPLFVAAGERSGSGPKKGSLNFKDKDPAAPHPEGVLGTPSEANSQNNTDAIINLTELTSLKEEQIKLFQATLEAFNNVETFSEKNPLASTPAPRRGVREAEGLGFTNNFIFNLSKAKILKPKNLKKGTASLNWNYNQFYSIQGKDTDLFIDLHPPKSFSQVSLIKQRPEAFEPIGMMVCQIFAGLFTKQISKNVLIVGGTIINNLNNLVEPSSGFVDEKSLLIQAIAGETELKIITDNAHRYAMVFRGVAVGIKLLRDVFDALSLHTPCLFLIEDIHAIGERRPFLISDNQVKKDYLRNNLAQETLDEKNIVLYQSTKHIISHYKKPYKGDFSLLIPTNHFCFDLFLGIEPPKVRQTNLNSKMLHMNQQSGDQEKTVNSSKGHQNSPFTLKNTNYHKTFIQNVLSTRLNNKGNSALIAPPATSPFSVLILKEEKKFKQKSIVKEMPWSGLPGEVSAQVSKATFSVRVKVAYLADMAISNLTVKLDMITDLLVIIDSVKGNLGFVVFATTHIPFILDPALRRPGRFDETISLTLQPSFLSRWEIFKSNYGLFTAGPQNYGFAANLPGFSYSLISQNFNPQFFMANLLTSRTSKTFVSQVSNPPHPSPLWGAGVLEGKKQKFTNLGGLSASPNNSSGQNQNYYKPFIKDASRFVNEAYHENFIEPSFIFNKDLKRLKYTKTSMNMLSRSYFVASFKLTQHSNYNESNGLPFLSPAPRRGEGKGAAGQSLYFTKGQKNQSILSYLQIDHLYTSLYSSNLNSFKKYLVWYIAGKVGSLLKSVSKVSRSSYKGYSSGSHVTRYETNQIFTRFEQSSFDDLTSLIFSFIYKRYIYQRNLVLGPTRTLFFTRDMALNEFSGPPSTNILLPAKRLEIYRRNFTLTSERSIERRFLPLNQILSLHREQRFIKKLYGYPIKELFPSIGTQATLGLGGERSNQNISNNQLKFTNFANSTFMIAPFEQFSLKLSNINTIYRTKILNRHRNYLTNQWWTGQLPEHNAEMTFASDIDWRYWNNAAKKHKTLTKKDPKLTYANQPGNQSYKELTEEVVLDFPDSDQYYNPRNRRWILSNGSFNYWFDYDKQIYPQIYTHYISYALNTAYNICEKNRENLDFYAFSFLKSIK